MSSTGSGGDSGSLSRGGSNTSPGKVTDGSSEISNVKRWGIDCKGMKMY